MGCSKISGLGIKKSSCSRNAIRDSKSSSSKNATDQCAKGSYCVNTYDSHACLCNQTHAEKPAGCYGKWEKDALKGDLNNNFVAGIYLFKGYIMETLEKCANLSLLLTFN